MIAVEPSPDAVADLDLQNGPDGCRLRGPAGESDLLGWGSPLDSTLCEGRAAANSVPAQHELQRYFRVDSIAE